MSQSLRKHSVKFVFERHIRGPSCTMLHLRKCLGSSFSWLNRLVRWKPNRSLCLLQMVLSAYFWIPNIKYATQIVWGNYQFSLAFCAQEFGWYCSIAIFLASVAIDRFSSACYSFGVRFVGICTLSGRLLQRKRNGMMNLMIVASTHYLKVVLLDSDAALILCRAGMLSYVFAIQSCLPPHLAPCWFSYQTRSGRFFQLSHHDVPIVNVVFHQMLCGFILQRAMYGSSP